MLSESWWKLYIYTPQKVYTKNIHWWTKLKDQPVFMFSCFEHNFSINERKNMKLRENICYEMIY